MLAEGSGQRRRRRRSRRPRLAEKQSCSPSCTRCWLSLKTPADRFATFYATRDKAISDLARNRIEYNAPRQKADCAVALPVWASVAENQCNTRIDFPLFFHFPCSPSLFRRGRCAEEAATRSGALLYDVVARLTVETPSNAPRVANISSNSDLNFLTPVYSQRPVCV